MVACGTLGLLGQAFDHRVVEPRVLAVDLPFLRRPVIEVVHRGEHGAEHQVGQRLQRMHQYRVVRGLADGQVEGMVQARVFTRVGTLLAGMGGEHLLVAPTQQDEIRVGAAQCGEPCRFAFQQRAHFQQVVEGARLRVEQVHQWAGVVVAGQLGDEGAAALGGLDDAAPAQNAQAFAQCRPGDAELLAQAALGGQRLADFEHAVDDQPFDALGHHVGDLTAVIVGFVRHATSPAGRTSWRAVYLEC